MSTTPSEVKGFHGNFLSQKLVEEKKLPSDPDFSGFSGWISWTGKVGVAAYVLRKFASSKRRKGDHLQRQVDRPGQPHHSFHPG
jgi:hypothetical protein